MHGIGLKGKHAHILEGPIVTVHFSELNFRLNLDIYIYTGQSTARVDGPSSSTFWATMATEYIFSFYFYKYISIASAFVLFAYLIHQNKN